MKAFALLFFCILCAVAPSRAAEKIRVSSFSTILTEIAMQVGGDRVDVTGHIKPGIDPHEFEPKPADLKIVSAAQLILLSAKHMEGYVGKLKESTGTKGTMVEVGDGLATLQMEEEENPGRKVEDPHWWHSIGSMQKAVRIVRDELIKASPADKASFTANAAAYVAKLDALLKWAKVQVAKLPRDKRVLVTSHDAFQYLAKEHGFTIHAIEGVSSSDQPSSKKVAAIIAMIKEQKVKAIFAETIKNPKVLTEITRETGAVLGGELYADGLGEGDASTYEGMYRHNISTIVGALK
jgi:ABC-type Zn uptake system ZnuABC Zn-binding protein ZnuA